MRKTIVLLLCAVLYFSVLSAADSNGIKESIVKIYTISNEPNYYQPWQMSGQSSSSGSGCIISGNRILTNAHVVSNRTFVQVRRHGQTKKYVANVIAVDHEVDLALLKVEDEDFFEGTKPIKLGKLPRQGDTVKVLGFPAGGDKLSITEGVVSRVEIGTYSHSLGRYLNIQIDAAINPGNSGGPVMVGNKLVGVAFQAYTSAENMGFAIPTKIIKHFLKDVKSGTYQGFPYIDIVVQTLENEAHRKYYGMTDKQTGIAVIQIAYDSSAWGILKEEDVIMAIDDIDIESDGTIKFGNRGRVDAVYYINSKYIGDKVKLKILRDKKVQNVTLILKKKDDIVPKLQYDVKPTYYIFGGMVFTPLTGNYIMAWGDVTQAPISLTNRFYSEIKTEEKDEVVVLLQVLADETNLGYHDLRSIVVEKLNGQKIKDLRHMIALIETNVDKYLVFELEGKMKLVANYNDSKRASQGILNRYMIPQNRSDNMK